MGKYIVTGGAGFIGSNLVRSLAKEHDIVVVDNFHAGNEENLASVEDRIEIIKTDCMELAGLEIEADGIFHLGMYSSSPMYKKDPSLVGRVVNGSIAVFELAKMLGIKVVYASTSSIYAGNIPPWREDMDIKVSDYYCEARYAVERLARLYNMLFGVKSVGLRFFSVYGPNEKSKGNYANLASQFLWAMKEGKRPVIYGDGKQKRDLIYVADVVRATRLAMEKGFGCEIFNVGTGLATSLNELVNALNMLLGTRISAQYVENPVSNYIPETIADCAKARNVLGFEAKHTLEDGLKEMIALL